MEFKYVAKDKKGTPVTDTAIAPSVSVLVSRLKSEGLLPIKVYEVKPSNGKLGSLFKVKRGKISGKELAVFTRQLATMLTAGLLLTEALETISEDMENKYFRGVLKKLREDIQGGHNFSIGLAKFSRIFPSTYVAIIKSGEATGNLDKTLSNLARYLENTERMKEKVKTAIRYPLFVLGFAIFVVSVIVLFIIPKFKGMFAEAGAQLPLLTRVVVTVSEFCLHNVLTVIILGIISVIAFFYLLRIPAFKFFVDVWKLKLPLIGKDIIHKAKVSSFCRTLGTLLTGGVGLSTSLEITSHVVDHLQLGQAIERIRVRVIAGSTLSDEIRAQKKLFPRLVSKMASVGEKTGRVDEMLKRTADYYDEELETALQNLTAILEPALIIFVGGMVLIVVLALYLPIFRLATAIR